MGARMTSGPVIVVKILLNSIRTVVLTLFLLALAVTAFNMGYFGAAAFFAIVTAGLGVILFRRVKNERVRAKFGEYRVEWSPL